MADDVKLPHFVNDSLALALVTSSDAPVLLLDGDFAVIAASDSFLEAFKIDPGAVRGVAVFDLGGGEWDVPELRALLALTLAGATRTDSYEMDLVRPGQGVRRLVIRAHRLEYGATDETRLMLAISDVTERRLADKLKDDLLQETSILFQELQHRVANSLQIIASVLLQSARRIPSEEVRGHLVDAHSRVMSIAALQQQLAASRLGEVGLRAYLTELCQSLGNSMIRDPEQLTLEVTADDGVATADTSVSLGLIVTELVINALKHAFPGGRRGAIKVGYESDGDDWTLSVRDDGVGMPRDPESIKPGLGSSIVEALARQLAAHVTVTRANPGTAVSVAHGAAARAEGRKAPAL